MDEQGPSINSSGIIKLVKNGTSQSGEKIGGGAGDLALTIDVSTFNPLFSNLVSTVQPASVRGYMLIRYA